MHLSGTAYSRWSTNDSSGSSHHALLTIAILFVASKSAPVDEKVMALAQNEFFWRLLSVIHQYSLSWRIMGSTCLAQNGTGVPDWLHSSLLALTEGLSEIAQIPVCTHFLSAPLNSKNLSASGCVLDPLLYSSTAPGGRNSMRARTL